MCVRELFARGKREQHKLDPVLVRERLAEKPPGRNGRLGDKVTEYLGRHVMFSK